MRINELLNEDIELDEGPLSALGRGVKRIGSAAASAIGADYAAGALKGSANISAKTDEYIKRFAEYIGNKQINPNEVDYGDIHEFLSDYHLPSAGIPTSGPASKADIKNVMKNVSSQYYGRNVTNYPREFNRYMTRIGKTYDNVDFYDVDKFLKSNNLQSSPFTAQGRPTPSQVNQILSTAKPASDTTVQTPSSNDITASDASAPMQSASASNVPTPISSPTTRQLKSNINTLLSDLDKLPPRLKQSVIQYINTKISTPELPAPAPKNIKRPAPVPTPAAVPEPDLTPPKRRKLPK